MSWDRKQRQEAILREKIAVIVLEKLNDPRLGFVTITGARLSRDRKRCNVLYTVLGSEAERRTTARALSSAVARIQELLSPTLRMRVMPELSFVYDEGVEKESRLLGLIEDLEAQRERRDAEEVDSPQGSNPSSDEPDETG